MKLSKTVGVEQSLLPHHSSPLDDKNKTSATRKTSTGSTNQQQDDNYQFGRSQSNSHPRRVISSNNNINMTIGTKPTLIANPAKFPMQFLIMDAPRQANLHLYIKECRKHHVTDLVRVCEKTYSTAELQAAGISVYEMEYPDGHSPPQEVIDDWLELVDSRFYDKSVVPRGLKKGAVAVAATTAANGSGVGAAAATDEQPAAAANSMKHSGHGLSTVSTSTHNGGGGDGSSGGSSGSGDVCIAVHCVAGLGRAPVMVAIALIEFANMDPVEAVGYIRRHRRGAINEKQLLYLEGYKKSYHKNKKRRHGAGAGSGAATAGDGGCGCTIM
jgi:protein tyrosine phosphatase type IVA